MSWRPGPGAILVLQSWPTVSIIIIAWQRHTQWRPGPGAFFKGPWYFSMLLLNFVYWGTLELVKNLQHIWYVMDVSTCVCVSDVYSRMCINWSWLVCVILLAFLQLTERVLHSNTLWCVPLSLWSIQLQIHVILSVSSTSHPDSSRCHSPQAITSVQPSLVQCHMPCSHMGNGCRLYSGLIVCVYVCVCVCVWVSDVPLWPSVPCWVCVYPVPACLELP